MRKVLVGLLLAGSLSMAAPAQAAPPVVLGSFVSAEIRAGQPHRLHLVVEAGKGSKECAVTLRRRTTSVSLGTDGVSPVFQMFFLRKAGTLIALHQAQTATSPTWRIRCTH